MTLLLLPAAVTVAFLVLVWRVDVRARRGRVVRTLGALGPVRWRDGVRASKAAQAAAAEGCVWCAEMPTEAGSHWRWQATWSDGVWSDQ